MDNSKSKSEYRSIFKATVILGGVQLFNIILGVARNKIVSLLLGPAGMGIIGLFQSALSTVSGFTNCGISSSVVKNVAISYENNNINYLGKIIYIIRRLVICTGTIASLILLIFCRQFSQISFGNDEFALAFACLSISLIFSQLAQVYQTVIKGCRYVKYYAKANVLGNLVSFLIAIPLYYIWDKDAIVPVLIVVSVSTFFFAYLYQKKIGINEVIATKHEFKEISSDVLKMGVPLAVSDIFPILASYLIRLFVSNSGSVVDVGLYSAGFAILSGYVGMIFTAMASDYVPRLSAIVNDNIICERTINRQILLSVLIMFPLILLLISFANLVVWILYSSDFYPMIGMICWGALGMIMKTYNWCCGILLVPKRESKMYFIFSVISAVVYLLASVIMYALLGITGLGVAFMISHAVDFFIVYGFIMKKYNIKLDRLLWLQLIAMIVVIVAVIIMNTIMRDSLWIFMIEVIIILIAIIYSISKLNKLMDLKTIILNKIKK